jgi:hypothetical protein
MKHCVQFLIDTILNLTIVQFFFEDKGRRAYSKRNLLSQEKGYTLVLHASPFT